METTFLRNVRGKCAPHESGGNMQKLSFDGKQKIAWVPVLSLFLSLIGLSACGDVRGTPSSVGIIGGADGPTSIFISGGDQMGMNLMNNGTFGAFGAFFLLIWLVALGLGVYLFFLVVALIRKAMMALDVYIEKNRSSREK